MTPLDTMTFALCAAIFTLCAGMSMIPDGGPVWARVHLALGAAIGFSFLGLDLAISFLK